MRLGEVFGRGELSYDVGLYEFRIAGTVVELEELRDLDARADVWWVAAEQRDWFRAIDADDLAACNARALRAFGRGVYDPATDTRTPYERVRDDAKRDDSILEGRVVDADPVLVQAVADALEQRGLGGGGTAPAAGYVLPQGMEALSQLQRQEGRKMTMLEHFLMRQILKNDDKEKVRREKEAASIEKEEQRDAEREERALKRRANVSVHQRRRAKRAAREESKLRERAQRGAPPEPGAGGPGRRAAPKEDGITYDQALAAVEASAAGRLRAEAAEAQQNAPAPLPSAVSPFVAVDSNGVPLRPDPGAMRPSLSQLSYEPSEEEKALTEMRARNLEEQSRYEVGTTDVPGMNEAGARRGRGGEGRSARINGREVNPDGTMKETSFDKFVDGLGRVTGAIGNLFGGGGGRGGGSGGGGMGGGMGMGGGSGGGMGMGGGMGGGGMGGM